MRTLTKKYIYKCFSLTHPRLFHGTAKRQRRRNQKLLVDNTSWDDIAQTGCFIFNPVDNLISGVSWQVSSWEDVTKEFWDGKKIVFDANTTVQLYPIILLGGGDTKWVLCAISKENMAGQHCNHCQRSQKDFAQGLGKPWTIQKIKNAADHYQNQLLPAVAHLATKPAGYLGVKNHLMYSIPIHLWGSPILHDELGLVKDWLTRLEKFADCRVEIVQPEEVELWELLVIPTNDLEDLLFENEELPPNESIKELQKHLARMEKEIKRRTTSFINQRTREPAIIPGRVTQEEQRIMDQVSWQITSWIETTKKLAEETKSAKEQIEKMTKKLKRVRETRDLTDESIKYAIDRTLCANGVDRKVYHVQCLIGPQIMKLLENRVEIMSQLEVKFLHVREENLAKDPTTDLASIEEIREEMVFFRRILNCYDCVFSLLRRTRTIFSTEERMELLGAIEILSSLWPTQRV
jgi:hypothetical protein